MDKFWKIFDERLELCHRALRARHDRLKGTPVRCCLQSFGSTAHLLAWTGVGLSILCFTADIPLSPLVMQAYTRYVKAMRLVTATDKEATPFALQVMQHMNDKCTEWKGKREGY